MNFYKTKILPKILNCAMGDASMNEYRARAVAGVSGTVLEIGFGSGYNLPHYTNVEKLYALEPSDELYRLADERIRSVSFPVVHILGSAEKIPLADNSVDAVVSTWTLCSIPDPGAALGEVARVLKPGGYFSFVDHGKSTRRGIARIQTLLTPVSKRFCGGCHLDRDIGFLLEKSGLNMEALEVFGIPGQPLTHLYLGKASKV